MCWIVVQCDPDECGADAVQRCIGLFDDEDSALLFLADVRYDDPDTGSGWTCMCVEDMRGEGM
jgi:hypothetical protein